MGEADDTQMSLLSVWVLGCWKAYRLHGNLQRSEIWFGGTEGHPAGTAAVCAGQRVQARVRPGAEAANLGHLLDNF